VHTVAGNSQFVSKVDAEGGYFLLQIFSKIDVVPRWGLEQNDIHLFWKPDWRLQND
jgi:hypothetical protein